MIIGTFSSSARIAAAKSPPIAEPPIPASTIWRTSENAGGIVARLPMSHASRTCFPRSLMRSSMLSLSAARIRSTVSMTDVSGLPTIHHPLPGVEHGLELVLRTRLGVHADEWLRPREAHEEPRSVLDEELHAVLRIEEHRVLHGMARDLARPLGVEPLHDVHLLLLVGRALLVQVAPQIEGGARHVHELGDELARLLLRLQHEIEEEEIGDDAIAL